MWPRKKERDIEMSGIQGQRSQQGPPEETEYQPVNWKKILLSPKYIRMLLPFCPVQILTEWTAWHILGIAILIATVLLSLHHDEVVAVSSAHTSVFSGHY
jgi:hypothetical protein